MQLHILLLKTLQFFYLVGWVVGTEPILSSDQYHPSLLSLHPTKKKKMLLAFEFQFLVLGLLMKMWPELIGGLK